MARSSGETSAWQTMTQETPISRARRIMSGWSPQTTMLSGREKMRFSQPAGRAMVISPEISSVFSPPALRMRPSSTERRL